MQLGAGQVFAGYTIVGLLGGGETGQVYLARHPRLPREDALKVLSESVSADPQFRDRFRSTADRAAGLWHPHIVGVHDRGEQDGRLWIAMDYVRGEDTGRIVERHPGGLPLEQVVAVVGAVASALDYAHGKGLLHRDVRPGNIMITSEDARNQRILLTDFGIARRLDGGPGLTAADITVGMVDFAAPEQLLGQAVDGRADQYSLAATCYFLLTGAAPFHDADPTVVIGRQLNAPPPRLAATHRWLEALDPVLARALSKDPAARFASCAEFATAVAQAVPYAAAPHTSAPHTSAPHASAPYMSPAPIAPPVAQASPYPDAGNLPGALPGAPPGAPPGWSRPAPEPAKSGRGARILAGVLAVLLLGTAIGAGVLGAQWRKAVVAVEASDDAGDEAAAGKSAAKEMQSAAEAFAVLLTSIDAKNLDSDIAQILDGSTGEFKDMYGETSGQLRQLLIDNNSTSRGNVVDSAVQSFDGDVGVVLLFVDQAVSGKNSPDPRLDRSRLKITMRNVEGRWLAEKVELP